MSGIWRGSRVTAIWPTAPSPRRRRVARSRADWLSSVLSVARAENSSLSSSYSKIVPPSVPESWTARPTIVVRTVSRSREELTARPTSPRAVSCSTVRVSSCVRACTVGAREPGERDLIAGDSGQRTRVRPQQADGAGQDRVEHGLHIRLRLADDPQDVAGGGLRVQRRRQLAVARLELREQPHVLDRDDGLTSERFEQRDVAVRESTCLLTGDS